MKIAILGYGLEGKTTEKYFKSHFKDAVIDVFDQETPSEFRKRDYSPYDLVFRSPSIPPLHLKNETSATKYFFEHCPCQIIGVTATKGKGTTCSFIKALLDVTKKEVYLVGNIGNPALDVLDKLTKNSIVIYELSSFQLWDLKTSPHISIIGHIEPDHLNVHKNYQDYLDAKSHIACYQSDDDYCIYYAKNPETISLAKSSPAEKIPYPFKLPAEVESAITVPGLHNRENAMAAIAAVSCLKNISPDEYLRDFKNEIIKGLNGFHGLPHRLELIREYRGVKYYDDNFSTNASSTKVAINAFPKEKLILILGGRDKTANQDLHEIYNTISMPQVKKIILIGESGHEIARRYHDPRFVIVNNLSAAVTSAYLEAEVLKTKHQNRDTIVLMSPAAASFDMFKNVYDRGEQYQNFVKKLK